MRRTIYLFCLAKSGCVPKLQSKGIDGDQTVFGQDIQGVSAIVCEAPVAEFTGPVGEANLQDLNWVGPRAVRHGLVIKEVMRYCPVLPARFGTFFSSVRKLERLISGNRHTILNFLKSMMDRDEWGVRVLFSRSEAREQLVAQELAAGQVSFAAMSPGVRYFKERQIGMQVDKELSDQLKENCDAVAAQLSGCSVDSKARDVVARASEGSDLETIANWAFLVHRSKVDVFSVTIERANIDYNSRGIFFRKSGPWPPYSFSPNLEVEPES